MCKHNIESIFVQQYQGLRSLFIVNCVVGNRLCNVDLGLAREVCLQKCSDRECLLIVSRHASFRVDKGNGEDFQGCNDLVLLDKFLARETF